jgi:hypothetical protein
MLERQLEDRVMPKAVGVIAVLVAGRDHQHAKAQDVRDAVPDPLGSARVLDAGREPLRNAEPALDLAQRQQATVRGELPSVEAGDDGEAGDR